MRDRKNFIHFYRVFGIERDGRTYFNRGNMDFQNIKEYIRYTSFKFYIGRLREFSKKDYEYRYLFGKKKLIP